MNSRKDSMGRHRPLKTRMPNAIEEANKRADEAPECAPTPIRVVAKGDNIAPHKEAQHKAVRVLIQSIEKMLDVEFVAFFYESTSGDDIVVSGNINQRMMGCNCENCAHTIELVRKMVAEEMQRPVTV